MKKLLKRKSLRKPKNLLLKKKSPKAFRLKNPQRRQPLKRLSFQKNQKQFLLKKPKKNNRLICQLTVSEHRKKAFCERIISQNAFLVIYYASLISRTSIGQAFTQIPHAIHLLAYSLSSAFTITPNGHASTHLPQPIHFFLSIM